MTIWLCSCVIQEPSGLVRNVVTDLSIISISWFYALKKNKGMRTWRKRFSNQDGCTFIVKVLFTLSWWIYFCVSSKFGIMSRKNVWSVTTYISYEKDLEIFRRLFINRRFLSPSFWQVKSLGGLFSSFPKMCNWFYIETQYWSNWEVKMTREWEMSEMVTVGLVDSLLHSMDRDVCIALFEALNPITSKELVFLSWFID